MAVKKKTAAKKAVKAAPKKAAPAKAAAPLKAITTKQTKSQIIAAIAEATGVSKKDVGAVFTTMAAMVEAHMKKNGSGEFTIPEVGVKIRRHKKPATKARKMISPFTGEEITVKAKPARNTVKLTALKGLKETVA
ncbi:HU family DNA-binding protein [Sulfurivermis fontis]|uniref:HU family DNA-binding protein n=1 Tax=Sulfurivermis fontis TaxID=1972068 RepID=UPI000FDB1B80|nr:HU family DNA-binding protein [Sulfurivermis fontis]